MAETMITAGGSNAILLPDRSGRRLLESQAADVKFVHQI